MTVDNIESMRADLVVECLPLTFQDAITATRELGFAYLWIDSLCIMQDSDEDWRHEAGRMQTYYKQATLTLAIDCTSGDHEGFLNVPRRDDLSFAQSSVRRGEMEPACTAYLRRWVDFVGSPRERTHLSGRAWTLQEDLLSPRSLHYTSDGLKWECQAHRISERDLSPIGINENEMTEVTKQYFLQPQAADDGPLLVRWPYMQKYFKPLPRWYSIVDEYSQRCLTFGKDRLIALNGVAMEVATQTGFTYLSGLWKEDLHFGLLWQIDARGVPLKTKRAPSWSWAALDIQYDWGQDINPLLQLCYGPYSLEWVHDKSRADISVMEPDTTLRTAVPAGFNADSVIISIHGLAMPLSGWHDDRKRYFRSYWRTPLSHTAALQWIRPREKDILICSFDADSSEEDVDAAASNASDCAFEHDSGLQRDQAPIEEHQLGSLVTKSADDADNFHTWDEEALQDVLMVQIVSGTPYQKDSLVTYALLLQPVETSDNVFRRVGIAEVPSTDNLHRKEWVKKEVLVL